MIVRPRVFISHSAKEPETQARLQDIVETLETAGFLTIVDDKRLENGEAWWEWAQEEIRSAHAVIILISRSALASEPVYREVVLAMSDRRDSAGLKRVFVLRLPDVRPEDIRDSNLGRLQLHDIHHDQVSDADTVRAVLPRMLQPLYDAYANRPNVELEAALGDWLDRAGPHSLASAARVLGLDPDTCRRPVLIIRLARQLLEFSGDSVRGTRLIQEFLEKIPPSGEGAAGLVDVLLSAAALPDSIREDVTEVLGLPDREAVSVAISRRETGLLYLRRACTQRLPWFAYSAVSVVSQEHLATLVADVRAQLIENLGFGDDEPSDAELGAELDDYERVSGPMTVILKAPPDPHMVRQLRGRFPRLLFFFIAGTDHPDQPIIGVRWVRPALASPVERTVLRTREQVRARHHLAS